MRSLENGDDADGFVSMVLRVRTMPCPSEAEGGGLLRVLFLRHRAMSADTGARQRDGLLRLKTQIRCTHSAHCAARWPKPLAPTLPLTADLRDVLQRGGDRFDQVDC